MSHIMIRKYQTKEGLKWTATEAVWSNEKRGSIEKKIEPIALEAMGFSLNMSPDQAREHAKKLNALNAIKRKEQASQIKAAERLTDLITIENSIIPDNLSRAFIQYLEENWFGGQYNLRKQVQHWNLVQRILTHLNIQPHEYFKRQRDFYKHFQKERYSKSYVEKLIKVINAWGEFYSAEAKTYYKKLPNPKGVVLEAIKDASDADGLGATPFTPDILDRVRLKLPPGQFEYLHATLWLGLRPSELDTIIEDPSKMKVRTQGNVKVVSVYQAKLVTIAKEYRWKNIPLFHPEMETALDNIQSDNVKKPLVKTIHKALGEREGFGLYSGRKGFTDLMLSLGQTLEDIAMWLGHASIERTWRSYKNKELVSFKEISLDKKRRA